MNAARLKRWSNRLDGTRVVSEDELLEPYAEALRYRYGRYWELRQSVDIVEGGLEEFSRGIDFFGFQIEEDGVLYREWAPAAKAVYLCGDFNDWNKTAIKLKKEEYGYWSIKLPKRADGSMPIPHMSKVKAVVETPGGMLLHRNPAAAKYLIQDNVTKLFDTVFWNPPKKYVWKHEKWLERPKSLRIYECHIGMATSDARVGSYHEFTKDILPKIRDLGFTAIQIMAVAEHAYYGSFGYHVTNPFAVSSRCGTPDDLKELVDTAHSMGLVVYMDLVHSHASSNSMDGINHFDGTDGQYFHEGEQGVHRDWDSRLYNYGHWEVLRYLLSNVRWWMEEYHFDGFRFDGVTSMLYKHHGIDVSFTGDYGEYFGLHVDVDACVYLMLANEIIHKLHPNALTIAEEVSGAPTVCQPASGGGLGFDMRLAMGIPNMWLRMLTEVKDEDWSMNQIIHELTNRRSTDCVVAYSESHDQAIVGDKTFAHWLMGEELFHCMGTNVEPPPTIDRGLALHKMIRLLTYAMGGDAYLSFMGNEFGHPEWIDFPREGNGFSHERARRRWDLAKDPNLRFKQLENWEIDMHKLETKHPFCRKGLYLNVVHASDFEKVIIFERSDRLLFVFNLHPSNSYTNYRVGTCWPGSYEVVLDSDALHVAGQGRVFWHVKHDTEAVVSMGRPFSMMLYLPARTCQVYYAGAVEEKHMAPPGVEPKPRKSSTSTVIKASDVKVQYVQYERNVKKGGKDVQETNSISKKDKHGGNTLIDARQQPTDLQGHNAAPLNVRNQQETVEGSTSSQDAVASADNSGGMAAKDRKDLSKSTKFTPETKRDPVGSVEVASADNSGGQAIKDKDDQWKSAESTSETKKDPVGSVEVAGADNSGGQTVQDKDDLSKSTESTPETKKDSVGSVEVASADNSGDQAVRDKDDQSKSTESTSVTKKDPVSSVDVASANNARGQAVQDKDNPSKSTESTPETKKDPAGGVEVVSADNSGSQPKEALLKVTKATPEMTKDPVGSVEEEQAAKEEGPSSMNGDKNEQKEGHDAAYEELSRLVGEAMSFAKKLSRRR